MRYLFISFFALAALLVLIAGCTGISSQKTIVATIQPQATETATPWMPPTALVGTPLPGAEATLAAAPTLRKEVLTITNSQGEQTNITAEIADTPRTRELGLMFRPSMPADAGMLFDFQGDTSDGFWMQNTILPLSIAFFQADGTIIGISDMQPLDTSTVGAPGPYRYALETNQGFFRVHNIAVGDVVTVPGSQTAYIPGMPDCAK